jgi:hypothetical protein
LIPPDPVSGRCAEGGAENPPEFASFDELFNPIHNPVILRWSEFSDIPER